MSNYPPGVSGNERMIAGNDAEYDEEIECGAEDVIIYSMSSFGVEQMNKVSQAMQQHGTTGEIGIIWSRFYTAMGQIEKVQLDACPFVGDATIHRYGYEEDWTCPLCGTEYNREWIPEDPNDTGRDN